MLNTQPQPAPRLDKHQVNIKAPDEFDFTKPELWPKWEKRFSRYISAANLSWKTNKEMMDLLCYTMGEQSEDILQRILPNAETKSYTEVLGAFRDHFTPKKNIILERFKFNSIVQLSGQSVDGFITSLLSQVQKCDYSIETEDLVRDRIVIGIRDSKTSLRLQLKSDLTLTTAITEVTLAEFQEKESKILQHATDQNKKNYPNTEVVQKLQSNKKNCPQCGHSRHQWGNVCPATNSTCRKCKQLGHWHIVCREKKVHCVVPEANTSASYDNPFCISPITHNSGQSHSGAAFTNYATLGDSSDFGLRVIANGSKTFTNRFFKVLANSHSGNLITSPLSAQILLAMAAYGAGGITATEMRTGLQLPENDWFGQCGYQSLIIMMNSQEEVELNIANKIFVASHITVKPAFQGMITKKFLSESRCLDFKDSRAAANAVNTWCEQQTKKRITKIVEPGSFLHDTDFVLVNALYFKGQWDIPFEKGYIPKRVFHLDNFTFKLVPNMTKVDSYRFGNLPMIDARFIEMPYKGASFSMIIIRPNCITGLKKVQDNLHQVNLRRSLQETVRTCIRLQVPKFKIISVLNLEPTLKTLGMTGMFQTQANFSKLTDAPLNVTKVLQTAFVEVNETGTEAAADTLLRAGAVTDIPSFVVDRPFYFAIYHKPTGISIFSGIVKDPVDE